jgi:arsenate reductase (thioredoxin)
MALLFLCVANSARSQLAEAITRHLAPRLDVWSAGSHPTHVRPEVTAVLEEVGIDARGLRSKAVSEIPLDEIELVVTLCADEVCPVLPKRVERLSWPLPDPSAAPRAESLEAFRATRDSLLSRIPKLLASLPD